MFDLLLNGMFLCIYCYVKCGSTRNWERKLCHKFPRNMVPRTSGINKLTQKVRFTGSLLEKNPARKHRELTKEKLDKTGPRLEYTPQKYWHALRKGPTSWNQQQLYIHSSLTLTCTRQVNFMLCNHVTKLGRFISASGFCTQLMMVKVILIWLLFWRSGVSFAQTFRQKIIGTGVPLIHKVKFKWCARIQRHHFQHLL